MVIGGQKIYIFGRKWLYLNKKNGFYFFVENSYIFGWLYSLSVIFVSVIFLVVILSALYFPLPLPSQ